MKVLLNLRDSAELAAGGASGIARGQALANESFREEAQMLLHLAVEFAIRAAPGEQAAQTGSQNAQSPHVYASDSMPRTRSITPAVRPQFSTSRRSCFRPDAVMA